MGEVRLDHREIKVFGLAKFANLRKTLSQQAGRPVDVSLIGPEPDAAFLRTPQFQETGYPVNVALGRWQDLPSRSGKPLQREAFSASLGARAASDEKQ